MVEDLELTTKLSQQRTGMSIQRTIMAADRTLMAWTRTALSMISFGFTVYKFLQYAQEENPAFIKNPRGPQNFGMALVWLGVISLLIACVQYWSTRKKIDPAGKPHFSLTFVVAGLIAGVGFLALANIMFRLGPF